MVRLIALVLCSIFVSAAGAQEAYPSRPVKFILPFPPGGGTDILGRVIAEQLSANLGQPVVTENRGGAGGNVGAEAAAHSAPDGYTIVLVAPSLAISKTLYSKLNYDPVKDFAPISLVATVPNVMITNPAVEAKNLQEFIELARSRPGAMNYGSGGAGTSNHLAGELFNIVTGTKLVHVPYKGVNLAMQGVLAGEIQLVFIGIPAALPHIKAGKLRALAVASEKRVASLPEVPTLSEAGVSGYKSEIWIGLFAPAKTPKDIVDKIAAEVGRMQAQADVKEQLNAQGIDPLAMSPEQVAALIKADSARWSKVVKETGVKAE